MKMIRYQVTWGGESTYVTAASNFEALQSAAKEWGLKWKEILEETEVIPLREVKAHRGVFS